MVNKITLIGRVGKEIDLQKTHSENTFAKFTIATQEKKDFETIWHNVTLWGNNAENAAKYIKKGDVVYIEGKQVNSSYEKEGKKYYTSEVVGYLFRMLGGVRKSENKEQTDEMPF